MHDIKRIAEAEARLNSAVKALSEFSTALEAFLAAQADIDALSAYLGSAEWYADLDADEKGLLPAELRRGVLSEDGIYNLLFENSSLAREAAELSRLILKRGDNE